MNITCLDVAVNNDDLNSIIAKRIPPNDTITNLRAALETDHLVFSGQAKLLLPINFDVTFKLQHSEQEIIAHLEDVRPMSAITDHLKNKILEKIVAAAPFLHLDKKNESIRIPLTEILREHGLEAHLKIQDLKVAQNQLTLKMRGAINL